MIILEQTHSCVWRPFIKMLLLSFIKPINGFDVGLSLRPESRRSHNITLVRATRNDSHLRRSGFHRADGSPGRGNADHTHELVFEVCSAVLWLSPGIDGRRYAGTC